MKIRRVAPNAETECGRMLDTGRWKGIGREDRVFTECNVLGDEKHFLFKCTTIQRDDLMLPENLFDIWSHPNVFQLIARLNSELI